LLIFDRSSVVAQPTSRKPLHRPQGLAHAARTQQAAALWLQALRSAGSLSSSGRASSLLSLSRNSTTTQSEISDNPTNYCCIDDPQKRPRTATGRGWTPREPCAAARPAASRPRVGGGQYKFIPKKRASALPVSCVLRRVKFLLYCLQPRADDAARRRQGNARAATELAAIHALKRRRALELARATSPQHLGTPRRAARRRDAVVTPSGRLAF